jgi:hypothetical protein
MLSKVISCVIDTGERCYAATGLTCKRFIGSFLVAATRISDSRAC